MSGEDLLRLVDTLGVEVAERHDLDPVDVGEAFHGARAAHTQPDEPYAYDRDRVDSRNTECWPSARAGTSNTITPSTML